MEKIFLRRKSPVVSYQITTAVIAVCIVVTILVLIRKDLLHTRYGLWWFGIAGLVLVFGFFPRLIDVIAEFLGVSYPPTLFITAGIGFLLIKILTMDLERSRQERKLRRFAQKLAIYEAQTPETNAGSGAETDTRNDSPKGSADQ